MSIRHEDVAPFELEPPPDEVLPLLMIRQSITRWLTAHWIAVDATKLQRNHPEDEVLFRCVAHLKEEAMACRSLAARAVQAWAGDRSGTLFVRDRDEVEPRLLRVQLGEEPALTVARPGDPDYPAAGGGDLLDLVEVERDFVCRSIVAVETDPTLRDRACANARERQPQWPFWDHLGSGSTPGSIARTFANCAHIPR